MANINDIFPSKYLSAGDLQGRRITLTMVDVNIEEVGRDREPRAVLKFKGAQKGMVLNKTNATKISQAYGEDTDGWFGQLVELYPTEVEFEGKPVQAIRIAIPGAGKPIGSTAQRPLEDATVGAPARRELDDDIPF